MTQRRLHGDGERSLPDTGCPHTASALALAGCISLLPSVLQLKDRMTQAMCGIAVHPDGSGSFFKQIGSGDEQTSHYNCYKYISYVCVPVFTM